MYDDFYSDLFRATGSAGGFQQAWVWISYFLLLIGVAVVALLVLMKFIPKIKQMIAEKVGDSSALQGITFLVKSLVIVQSANVILRNMPAVAGRYIDFLQGILAHTTTLLNYLVWLAALGIGLTLVMVLSKTTQREE